MFNSFYVRLNLLDDPGLPLRLLGRATALVDLLGQPLDVPLGVQQVGVVRVVFSGVFEQVLQTANTDGPNTERCFASPLADSQRAGERD